MSGLHVPYRPLSQQPRHSSHPNPPQLANPTGSSSSSRRPSKPPVPNAHRPSRGASNIRSTHAAGDDVLRSRDKDERMKARREANEAYALANFNSLERQSAMAHDARVLGSWDLLTQRAINTNDSIPQTRLHHIISLANLEPQPGKPYEWEEINISWADFVREADREAKREAERKRESDREASIRAAAAAAAAAANSSDCQGTGTGTGKETGKGKGKEGDKTKEKKKKRLSGRRGER